MEQKNTVEQKILEAVQFHQTNKPGQYQGTNPRFTYWYQTAHSHLRGQLIPKLTASLVDYWPTLFLWGANSERKRGTFDDRTYLYREGTFGTGYIVLTLDNLYTVSLKELTARYPKFDTGFMGMFMSNLGGVSEQRRPLKQDNVAVIPVDSILGAQVIKTDENPNTISVRTANETIQIYEHFTGTHDEIVTAIRMVKSGKLATLIGLSQQPVADAPRPQPSDTNDLHQLQKLKQMLDMKLITEKEYEAKKAEILARM